MNDDVLIVGSLKDEELRKSIDNLVDYVGNKTNEMAMNFNDGLDKMKLAMKDFAITQKVSVDLMKEAWREMSSSFDAMVAAQSGATGGGSGSGKPAYEDDTIGALKQEIAALQKERDELKLNSDELREQNRIIDERQRKLKEQTTNLATLRLDRTMRMPSNDLEAATKKLRALEIMQRRYKDSTELSEKQQKRLADAIDSTKKAIDRLTSAKPKTLKEVIGMDESTVDAVARKMRALRTVTVNPNNKNEIRALGNEYQRLSRLQADLLGKGIQLTHSNNYLAQSFGYIRNRIVYALTLGAITNFTKQIYEVRGQYELLERSLGILIDDMRKGSEMFNELNQMALKSPFTLMELATGAKQLLAYNFAEEEVVDTTRRLADISAALGVPMERLVYNLGQIKAQTALTARDARDFANAGLAIVPMLAQMYTEEKRFGDEIVTTAQVFDMMSKKMVTYGDVIKVINKVTNEGGKFYDFQAKQAETLRVKMANLTLAWNNMLNEIGSENQKALTLPVTALKTLFENWSKVYEIVRDVAIMYGIYRARAILVAAVNGTLITQGVIKGMFQLGRAVAFVANSWKILSAAVASNPIGAIATVITATAAAYGFLKDNTEEAAEYQERFGKAGAKVVQDTESLFDSLTGISRESSNYKKVLGELNSILEEYGIETVKETDGMDVLNEKRRVAISLIKEETLERKHLNDVQQGRDEYASTVEDARNKMRSQLKEAVTGMYGFVSENQELRQNASAIANIISDVVEQNITLIAGKTGEEYEQGVHKIYDTIQQRMRDIGISESTISKQWLDDTLFLKNDIVGDFIGKIKDAKEAQDQYIESIDKAYEAEKKATEGGADFNDRVEQTQTQLMKAANDTDNFYKKIDKLIKDYSGLNIIDFLVKVKTEVPAWMSQKGLTELTQLSARFTALATQAKKAGRESLNVNGKDFSVQQLFERAAQYAQAAQNKQADIESRKSTTITREASEALKEYKSALEAVNVAKNRQKQGTADQALVTEKETEAQKAYNKALEKGVSLDELRKAKDKGRSSSKKDPLGDALEKEIQLVSDMQKLYKEYQKAGVDADKARIASAKEYEKTLQSTNAKLQRYGIKGLTGDKLATMDARDLREYYLGLRDIANLKGNTKGVEALEKAIRSLNIEITKVDYKKFTDSLNNDLAKVKDEYELAVEFDANPELGDIFADMMGIDTEELQKLPRSYKQVVDRLQTIINNAFATNNIDKQFDLVSMLDKGDFETWVKEQGQSLDGAFAKALNNIREHANKIRLDEAKETTQSWSNLVEKYGDLQAKLVKIAKDTSKEQLNIIKKFGTENEKQQALNISEKLNIEQDPENVSRLQRELADLMNRVVQGNPQAVNIATATENEGESLKSKAFWEDFKQSELYSMTFEDMSRVSTSAIQLIIDKLEELRGKVQEDPASMKALTKSLEDARKELEGRSGTLTIVNALKEYKTATVDLASARQNLAGANSALTDAENQLNEAEQAGDATAIAKAVDNLRRAREKQKEAEEDVVRGENDVKKSTKKLQAGMETLSSELQNIQGLFGVVAKLFAAGGDDETAEAINAISEGFSIMTTIIMGVVAAMELLESTQPWLLAIAAALSVIVGLVSWLSDSNKKEIDKQVKQSEIAVKRLENLYKNLEAAVSKAIGAQVIAFQKAEIANKKLQLAELQRQLQLERSRDSKDYDASKVADLEGQIIDLKNDIQGMKDDITNTFLGISSVSDAVSSVVGEMINALREGEDAMDVFGNSIDDMVANMIKQVFSARIVGPMLEKVWDKIDAEIQKRGEGFADAYANYQTVLDHINTTTGGTGDGYYFWKDTNGSLSYSNSLWEWQKAMREGAENLTYQQWQETLQAWADRAKKNLQDATTPTMDDVRKYASGLREVSPELEQYMDELYAILDEMGLIKDQTKADALSKLQQGIEGVTEDTAGAIEAYMNIVAQRVFEQNEYLMQIRDIVVGFNLDVQVATIGQILYQMQQSYLVQQAIQSRLDGWSNSNGMAVRVEMV